MTVTEALGTIRRIGPVEVAVGNHGAAWVGTPDPLGVRDFSLSGSMREPETARMLLELVDNPDARISFGPHWGVLEYIDAWGTYADLRGWALLQSFTYSDGPQDADADVGWGPFALSGVMLGERELVATSVAAALDTDFPIAAEQVLVQPLWGPEPAGEPFLNDAPGTPTPRAYDPRTEVDVRNPGTDPRSLLVYRSAIS